MITTFQKVNLDQLENILIKNNLKIKLYIEKKFSPDKISKEFKKKFGSFNKKLIMENINLIDRNEYKRRQSPPGVKISNLALGKDRRLPISSGWKNL